MSKKLETIFDENNISRVHYLSIDVEGAEFEVIKSINFEKIKANPQAIKFYENIC